MAIIKKAPTTSGELREYLSGLIIGLDNGSVEPEKARHIIKAAAQINESFYSEIKVAKVMLEAGKSADVAAFGNLAIGGSK